MANEVAMAFRINHLITYGIPVLAAMRTKMSLLNILQIDIDRVDKAVAHLFVAHALHPDAHKVFAERFPDFVRDILDNPRVVCGDLCSRGLSNSITWSTIPHLEMVLDQLYRSARRVLVEGYFYGSQSDTFAYAVNRLTTPPRVCPNRRNPDHDLAPSYFNTISAELREGPLQFLREVHEKWNSAAASSLVTTISDRYGPTPPEAKTKVPWHDHLPPIEGHGAYLNGEFLVTYTRRVEVNVDRLPAHMRPDPIPLDATSGADHYVWVPVSPTKQETIKPGRYLTTFYPHLTPDEVTGWARKVDVANEVQFATTADEMVRIYTTGPSSCMSYSASNFKGVHPVKAYAGGDLAVAYFADPTGKPTARALVWPEKKLYGRAYGDPERLQRALQKLGYTSGSLRGAKLAGVARGGNLALPYIDGENYVTVNRATGEMFLGNVVGSHPQTPLRGHSATILSQHGGTSGFNGLLRVCSKSGKVGYEEYDFVTVHSSWGGADARKGKVYHLDALPDGAWKCAGSNIWFTNKAPKVEHEGRPIAKKYFDDNYAKCSILKRMFPKKAMLPRIDDTSVWISIEYLDKPDAKWARERGQAVPCALTLAIMEKKKREAAKASLRAYDLERRIAELAAERNRLYGVTNNVRSSTVAEVRRILIARREAAEARRAARLSDLRANRDARIAARSATTQDNPAPMSHVDAPNAAMAA